MDFERRTTVGLGADAAFARLADPLRIPDYVSLVRHEGSDAEEGVPDEAEAAEIRARGVPEARFFADAAARRLEWGEPGSDYHGSITVEAGTASTSTVVVRLHVRDEIDRAKVDEVIDASMRGLRRILSSR